MKPKLMSAVELDAIAAAITGKVNRVSAQKSVAKPLMLGVLVEYL